MESDDQRPHVVILGGGFGGLYIAKPIRAILRRQKNTDVLLGKGQQP